MRADSISEDKKGETPIDAASVMEGGIEMSLEPSEGDSHSALFSADTAPAPPPGARTPGAPAPGAAARQGTAGQGTAGQGTAGQGPTAEHCELCNPTPTPRW